MIQTNRSKQFYVSFLSNKKPLTGYLNVGFSCINNCVFCAVADVSSINMDTKTAIAAIDYCREVGCKVLTISGGEPTIRKDFITLIKYAKSSGLDISLQTNARKLSNTTFCNKVLKAGVFDFYVSIHGNTNDVHDGLTRVNESFRETVKGLINLARQGARVDTNFVITTKNFSNIPRYAEWLVHNFDNGVGCLYFTYPTPVGNAYKFASEILPSFSMIKSALAEAIDFLQKSGKKFSLVDVPLCVVDTRYFSHHLSKPITPYELYIEPIGTRWVSIDEPGKTVYSQVCVSCIAKEKCPGLYRTYLRLYKENGLKSFKI